MLSYWRACLILIILWPLLEFDLAFANTSSPSSTSIDQTSLARVNHVSTVSTSTTRPPSTAYFSAVPTPIDGPEPLNRTGSNFLGPLPQVLQAFEFKTYTGENFNTTGYSTHTLCWYPVSGNYGTLPRILLYFTLIFAVVARTQEWLIAGALTAGLTYSGTAAIHSCLLFWRGDAWGELDALGLYAVLSSSCLVMVPLLNWSSTLRNLGRIGLKREPTRAIILYWSFLVGLGFMCTFILYGGDGHTPSWGLYTWSGVETIQCTPQGNLSLSAGQVSSWTDLVLDLEFIQDNGCENPCSTSFSPNPLFRADSDLQIVTRKEREFLDSWYFRVDFENSPAKHDVTDVGYFHYVTLGIWSIAIVVVQGIYAACFGRRTPAQARTILYTFLRAKLCSIRLAKSVATFIYLWAVVVLLLCPVFFLLNLVSVEIYLSNFPESDPLFHVGAWSSWAATLLVLFAALISRYHEDVTRVSSMFKERVTCFIKIKSETLRLRKNHHRARSIYLTESSSPRYGLEASAQRLPRSNGSTIRQVVGMVTRKAIQDILQAFNFSKSECQLLIAFWKDPENTMLHDRHEDGTIDLLRNVHSQHGNVTNKEMSFSRSATLAISRSATTETLVNLPNNEVEGRKFDTMEISPSPPLPVILKYALAKSVTRGHSHRTHYEEPDSSV